MSGCDERMGFALTRFFALVLFSSLGILTTAGAASIELPAINTPATAEHHVGKIIWADLVTPDLSVAERFYGGLFGWTFQSVNTGPLEYAVARLDGRPVGGIFQRPVPSGQHRQSAWLTFIAVRDADAVKRVAVSHGAKVLAETKTYPLRGRQAVLTDPEGAVFAVLASSTGDPPDFLAAPGEWIWSSLLSKDPSAETAFYQDVFDYEAFDVASDDGVVHVILSSDEFARASVNAFPSAATSGVPPRRHAHWLNFVRVASTADAVSKAVSLGGRVLVEPHVDRHGGQAAVVADPAGAPLGLMEWSDSDSKAEPK